MEGKRLDNAVECEVHLMYPVGKSMCIHVLQELYMSHTDVLVTCMCGDARVNIRLFIPRSLVQEFSINLPPKLIFDFYHK